MENQTAPTKQGYAKLHDSCRQACLDKLEWIWIDTCCIDKTSSAELSEAINTMFRWYQEAVVCYAFLADVPSDTTLDGRSLFATSRWFTRGWTLQELLAPKRLEFYSREWTHLGTKSGLSQVLREITGVGESYLEGLDLSVASIAARMSWAAKRETTREEDRAYSLLGIFGVHIPLLYGEGGYNAFIRLQEELIRTTDDQSIFAWHSSSYDRTGPENWHSFSMLELPEVFAFWLANSPAWFLHCGDIVTCNSLNRTCPFVTINAGIRIELSIVYDYEINPLYKDQKDFMVLQPYAWLNCRKSTDYWNIMAVPVTIQGDKCMLWNPNYPTRRSQGASS
ncbi:Vegetative incompatibility protein HET-E-1 [Colletotrichum siamense]|nr:Vegetative incompatibility protein HET-E-1 [Colletotrichum siamense]